MNIVPWNPFKDMDNVNKEMSNFFDRMPFSFLNKTNWPKIDIYETTGDIIIKAEVPGVSKEDLDVYIDDNSIRLSGQTKKDTEYKDENSYRSERFYGNFSRTIPLPLEVKSEQAKAEYKNGILSLTIPKVESSKVRGRKLNID